MAYVLGVLLLLSIVGFIWYAVKGRNLMVGFFIMALLWLVIGLVGHFSIKEGEYINGWFGKNTGIDAVMMALNHVFQAGPAGFAQNIVVNIFFGALFGIILIKTNIASTIVKKTVELSGDKPRITLAAIMIVTVLLFVNMNGIGPVMAIAVIVFPILKTLGIPSPIALFAFMGSIMCGLLVNPITFVQMYGFVSDAAKNLGAGALGDGFINEMNGFGYGAWTSFGWIACGVALFILIVVCNVAMGFKKKTYSWAVNIGNASDDKNVKKARKIIKPNDPKKDAPWYSWIAILLPVGLITLFQMQWNLTFSTILAFTIASLYALIVTGSLKGGFNTTCAKLSKYFTEGVVEIAPMVGFLMTLAMFNNAGALNAPYLKSIVGDLFPKTALPLAIVFAALSVTGFFRGFPNMVGAGGVGFVTVVLVSIGVQSSVMGFAFMYALFAILTIVIQHYDITQSWVAWGLAHTRVSNKAFMKLAIPTGYITAIILCLLAYLVLAT